MARIAVLVLVAGCSFEGAKLVDAADTEPPLPDAGPCIDLGETCAGHELRRCSAVGSLPEIEQCRWTCLDGPPARCGELEPSGGALLPSDLDTSTLADVTFPDGAIIDADNGRIGTAVNGSAVRSPGTGVINGIDLQLRAGNVAILRMKSLVMSGTVSVIGDPALVIVTDDEIRIRGVVDMRGPCTGPLAGPGGFDGGAAGAKGLGDGGGPAGQGPNSGGGAGHGGSGGAGGGAATGGSPSGDASITKLVGGSGGGGGTSGGSGGGGGGALQLVSQTRVVIEAGGGINAGGCGGRDGTNGGGGGAGGAILIEAPSVEIAGAIAVNGGGGGGIINVGGSGTLDRTPAPGGSNNAGVGAAGAMIDGGAAALSAGGGGGGIGRIRIHTRDGMATLTGVASPHPSDPKTTCTIAAATLR